jgi:G:T-mismatch repair DNA endonuclease (very short patch repair protein)
MFKCPRCSKEFDSYLKLAKHTNSTYKLKGEELYREYHNIIEPPTCKCGCGTPTKWRIDRGYGEFVNGHNSRGKSNPMYGKTHTSKARDNISQKRKEKFANGEYRIWQNEDTEESRLLKRRIGDASKKENNPVRAQKISNALKGRIRTEEHQSKLTASIKRAWENPELRQRQRNHAFDRITENGWQITSKLENKFSKILDDLEIQYHRQYAVREIKALYDFYLSDYNILIEVHGDFWHCNPLIERFSIPKYAAQISNVKTDAIKKSWCEKNKMPLLIFWETDINNRPSWVIQQLLIHINQYNPTI